MKYYIAILAVICAVAAGICVAKQNQAGVLFAVIAISSAFITIYNLSLREE